MSYESAAASSSRRLALGGALTATLGQRDDRANEADDKRDADDEESGRKVSSCERKATSQQVGLDESSASRLRVGELGFVRAR